MLLISRLINSGRQSIVDLPEKTFDLKYAKNKVEEVDDIMTFFKKDFENTGLHFDSFMLGKLEGFQPITGFTNYLSRLYIELGVYTDVNNNQYYYRNANRMAFLHDISVDDLTSYLDYLQRNLIFYGTIEDVDRDLSFHVKVNNIKEETKDSIIEFLMKGANEISTERSLWGERIVCATTELFAIDKATDYVRRGDYPFRESALVRMPFVSTNPFE